MSWSVTLTALAAALVGAGLAWLFTSPAPAAVPPHAFADLVCDRETPVPAIKLDHAGRMLVSFYGPNGCVEWAPWVPMVRSR